jgi:hypothetical protein
MPTSLIGNSVMAAEEFACLHWKKWEKEMKLDADIW